MRTNRFGLLSCLVAASLVLWTASTHAQDVIGRDGKQTVKLEWDKLDTKNYAIMYEKGLAKQVAKKISVELEDILVQYKKLFPAKQKQRFLVQLLDSQNAYEQVGGDASHPGFYSPGNRTLVLLNRPFYDLIPTTYHEAFHQYIDFYCGYDAPIPTWFNEGMASYYEGMERDENKKGKPLNPKKINVKKISLSWVDGFQQFPGISSSVC